MQIIKKRKKKLTWGNAFWLILQDLYNLKSKRIVQKKENHRSVFYNCLSVGILNEMLANSNRLFKNTVILSLEGQDSLTLKKKKAMKLD